jgi:hypothetical protein
VRLDIEVDIFEHEVQALTISGAIVDKVHCAGSRPADWWSVSVYDFGSFAWQACIFQHSFHRNNIRLDFYRLANNPVQGLGDLEGIRHGQADQTSRQATTCGHRDDGKPGRTEDND